MTFGQLLPEQRRQLRDAQHEAQVRELQRTWAATEETITAQLLGEVAAEASVGVAKLLETAFKRARVAPSEAEIQRAYAHSRLGPRVTYDDAKEGLRGQLEAQAKRIVAANLVREKRRDASIRYILPLPRFHRLPVMGGAAPRKGPANAPVKLVMFLDYQCSFCHEGNTLITELARRFPEDLEIAIKGFPLPGDAVSGTLAKAGHCAHAQGRYWAFHQQVFAAPTGLGDKPVLMVAEEAGLDSAALASCMAKETTQTQVAETIAYGRRYGITGVPAIFLNGIRLNGVMPIPLMERLIKSELNRLTLAATAPRAEPRRP